MLGLKLSHLKLGKIIKNKTVTFGVSSVVVVLLIGSLGWAGYLYMLSKTDCAKVTSQASQSIKSKNYNAAYNKLSANKRACSKSIAKQKTNPQKITTMNYEASLAKAASESGNKDVAKEHIRKSIDSLRKVDFVKISGTDKKSFEAATLTPDQIFELDYQLHKKPDGSYEGYND